MKYKKKQVEKENPAYRPSKSVEKNLAQGIDEEVPDPDDVPGGWDSTFKKRPDLEQSAIEAQKESEE